MFSKIKQQSRRSYSGSSLAAKVALGFGLLALAGASAQTSFTASGTLADSATFSGTLTIDTIAGVATGVDITITAPDSLHAQAIQAQFSGGTFGWVLMVGATTNSSPVLVLVIPVATSPGTLAGYTGGTLSTLSNLWGGPSNPLVSGSLSANVPLSIVLNPTDQTFCPHSMVSFIAAARGIPTPTVQWQMSTNGGAMFNDLPFATANTLTLFDVSASQSGNQYRAVFSNTSGNVTTTAARLSLDTGPSVTINPVSQSVTDMQTATFTAGATGSFTTKWQVSTDGGVTFNDIPGQTSATLSFSPTLQQDGNQYRAILTSSCGSVTTAAATLNVTWGAFIFFFG